MEGVGKATNTYSGRRHSNGTTAVIVNGRPLGTRPGLRHAAATTFDWGYEGRGAPSQLALAILAHHLGDDERARRHHEHFLKSVIRKLPSQAWTLTGAEIDCVLP